MPTSTLRIVSAIALMVSGAVHLQQWLTGYSSTPTTGWMFLAHFVAATVITVMLFVRSGESIWPLAGIALSVGSLLFLGIALVATFINLSEEGLRAATVIAIVAEVVATGGLAALLQRSRSSSSVGTRSSSAVTS